MIASKELMCGNYLMWQLTQESSMIHDRTILVDYWDNAGVHGRWIDGGMNYSPFYLIDPIPITPEWLERLGFEKVNSMSTSTLEYIATKFDRFYVRIKDGNICLMTETDDYDTELVYIDHIHQLQNIYFALTGQELTVKESKLDALKDAVKDHLSDIEGNDQLKVKDVRRNEDDSFTIDFAKS